MKSIPYSILNPATQFLVEFLFIFSWTMNVQLLFEFPKIVNSDPIWNFWNSRLVHVHQMQSLCSFLTESLDCFITRPLCCSLKETYVGWFSNIISNEIFSTYSVHNLPTCSFNNSFFSFSCTMNIHLFFKFSMGFSFDPIWNHLAFSKVDFESSRQKTSFFACKSSC